MAIDTGIPSASSFLVPGFYFTITPTPSSTVAIISRVIIIGQITNDLADAGYAVPAADVESVATLFGRGSMLSEMYRKFRGTDPTTEVYLLPILDVGGATKAVTEVTFTGTPVTAGVHSIYVNGLLISVPAPVGASASTIAASFAALVNQQVDLAVTATSANGTTTLTAKNAGLTAGDSTVIFNAGGLIGGEQTPAGTGYSIATTPGTIDPDLTPILLSLGDLACDLFVCPYPTVAAFNAFDHFLSDSTGRWGYTQQLFGFATTVARGDVNSLTTLASLSNSRYVSVLGLSTLEPSYVASAAYSATCSASLSVDPALTLSHITIDITGYNRFDIGSRNTLLTEGISTALIDDYGTVTLERAVTLNKRNLLGLPDASWRDVETLFTLSYVVRTFRQQLAVQYARKKLVDDKARIPAFGSNFTTSKDVLATSIGVYRTLAADGIVSDPQTFAANARSENGGQGRVNMVLPIVLANQLRQIAINFSFAKS